MERETRPTIIDAHTHTAGVDFYNLFIPRYPLAQSTKDLMFKMDSLGIDYAIVLPMPFPMYYDPREVRRNNKWVQTGLEEFPYQVLNKSLLYETANYQDRVFPFLAVDPREKVDEQARFLERNILNGRVFGLKLHTLATSSPAPRLDESPFVDLLEQFDLPILIHSGRSDITSPLNALEFAKKHPKIRVCIAHLAGFDRSALQIAQEIDNVFLDTSPFLSHCKFAEQGIDRYVSQDRFETDYGNPLEAMTDLSEYLKGKLIWGSDEPWTSISSPDGNALSEFSYSEERAVLSKLIEHGKAKTVKEIGMASTLHFIFGNRTREIESITKKSSH